MHFEVEYDGGAESGDLFLHSDIEFHFALFMAMEYGQANES